MRLELTTYRLTAGRAADCAIQEPMIGRLKFDPLNDQNTPYKQKFHYQTNHPPISVHTLFTTEQMDILNPLKRFVSESSGVLRKIPLVVIHGLKAIDPWWAC